MPLMVRCAYLPENFLAWALGSRCGARRQVRQRNLRQPNNLRQQNLRRPNGPQQPNRNPNLRQQQQPNRGPGQPPPRNAPNGPAEQRGGLRERLRNLNPLRKKPPPEPRLARNLRPEFHVDVVQQYEAAPCPPLAMT